VPRNHTLVCHRLAIVWAQIE